MKQTSRLEVPASGLVKNPSWIAALTTATSIAIALIAFPASHVSAQEKTGPAAATTTPAKFSPASTQDKAQEKARQTDESTSGIAPGIAPGIAIGETLPAIELSKQDGTEVSIQELAKQGPVAMVFYRSASW